MAKKPLVTHVHLEDVTYVDHACLELFVNWEKQHKTTGGKLVMDWEDLTATFRSAGSSDRNRARLARETRTESMADMDTNSDNGMALQAAAALMLML